MKTTVTLYDQQVEIHSTNSTLNKHLTEFVERFYTSENMSGDEEGVEEKYHVYAGFVKNGSKCMFLNEQFKHFLYYIKQEGYQMKDYDLVMKQKLPRKPFPYEVRDGWDLWEKQVPVYKWIMSGPRNFKLLPLSMGSGKTFLAIKIMVDLGELFSVVVLPKFQDQWVKALSQITTIPPENVIKVVGKTSSKKGVGIRNIVDMAKKGLMDDKICVFSLPTMYGFFKAYEEDPEMCEFDYGCTPIELSTLLGVGNVISDESHLSFFSLYKFFLYYNTKFVLGASGTFIATNPLEEHCHNTAFPPHAIYHDNMRVAYMNFVYATYTIENDVMRKIKFTGRMPQSRGREVYSHTAFEASILRDKRLLMCYLNIVGELVQAYYLNRVKSGQKLILFVSTVLMATKVKEFLERKLPKRNVVRYCEADKYEDMLLGDVVVTTNISAGTGVDIPGLITGVQTVSMGSDKTDLQASGRLRPIEGEESIFVCLHSDKIRKQVEYQRRRLAKFDDYAKDISYIRSSYMLTFDKRFKEIELIDHFYNDPANAG